MSAELTDAWLAEIRRLTDLIDKSTDPTERVRLTATHLQPAVGMLMRATVGDAREAKVTWTVLGGAARTTYTSLCRQFMASGPMQSTLSRATHRRDEK